MVLLLVGGVLYLPVRRELLDRGMIEAASFRSSDGQVLTVWDNYRYDLSGRRGVYSIEKFPEVPWISLIRLDSGLTLHVRYDDRVFRVEDIPNLTTAQKKFVRR